MLVPLCAAGSKPVVANRRQTEKVCDLTTPGPFFRSVIPCVVTSLVDTCDTVSPVVEELQARHEAAANEKSGDAIETERVREHDADREAVRKHDDAGRWAFSLSRGAESGENRFLNTSGSLPR